MKNDFSMVILNEVVVPKGRASAAKGQSKDCILMKFFCIFNGTTKGSCILGTINLDVYWEQLHKLKEEIAVKQLGLLDRKKVIFHHNNDRPHVA